MKVAAFRTGLGLLADRKTGLDARARRAIVAFSEALAPLNATDLSRLSVTPRERQCDVASRDYVVSDLLDAISRSIPALPPNRRAGMRKGMAVIESLSNSFASDSVLSFAESLRSASVPADKPKGQKRKMVNEGMIDDCVAQLEAALGDNAKFSAVIAAIERNPAIRQRELAAIGSKFAGRMPADTPRAMSLRRIWARQQSLMDFKAKSAAQAGKSAA